MNKDDKAVALKEAEMLLIGAVIAIPDLYYEVDSMLSPEVFSSENNRVVWKAITDIVDCGDPVVTTSIARRIVGKALLAEGQTELSLVQSMVATFDDNYISGTFLERQKTIQGQAAELLSAQERRSIQNVLTQGQKKAQEPSLSNEALADWVETKVSECVKARIRSKAATEVFQESSRHVAFLADNPQLELGVTAKLNAWNRLVGPMAPGDLIVVGGATSMGKTALVQQIAKEVMEKAQARGSDGGGVVVFSLEMTSVQWVNRYISQQTGIPTERLEVGPITMEEQEKVKRAAYDTRHDLMRLVDNGSLTVRHMLNEVKVQNRRKQVDLVVIDHLQFIEHPDPRKEGPAKTADITRQLKAMAKNIKAPVILISHLNRDIASRPNKRPQLSDLFGSSAIEKDADCVLFVHREHYWIQRAGPDWSPDPSEAEANRLKWEMALLREKDRAELILAKRRRGSGAGSCSLQFHADTTLFKD